VDEISDAEYEARVAVVMVGVVRGLGCSGLDGGAAASIRA